MATSSKKKAIGKKILIGILIFLLISAAAFQIFITRYLPSLAKKRLSEIIVNGSDSLYKFEMGKFDLSFWGSSAHFTNLHITIDSTVYKRMSEAKKLPPLTLELFLPKGHINGLGLNSLIFSRKINIREIVFDSADVKLARHFKNSQDKVVDDSQPLWKLIQPRIRSIRIGNVYCADLKIKYRNIDSAAAFQWQFEKSNILFSDIRVDSIAAMDSNRLLFAGNVSFNIMNIKLKTTDGLYNVQAKEILYSSAARSMDIQQFDFLPAISDQQIIKHFGFQHEIYKLKVPVVKLKNFALSQWVTYNKLQADLVELASPVIAIHMDRNAKPNPYSKIGNYPHQQLQKLSFILNIKKLKATDASVTYTETNNVTNLTGKINFPALAGTINNITNDPIAIKRNSECIANIQGSMLRTGILNSVLVFKLDDRSGTFKAKISLTNLDAAQMQHLFKAMTAVEIQTFNMKRLDFIMDGNENKGNGALKMQYDNLDILLNKVEPDKSLNRKGFFSFLANRLVVYKENPMNGEEEKTANGIILQRDVSRSFFNLLWKTMFTAAGEIVLRPLAQRRIEKKQGRKERREERRNKRKK